MASPQELMDCIYLYFEEVNRDPVVYHWTYKMDEICIAEAIEAGVKSNDVCVGYLLFNVLETRN